jgi:hypothetical protein
MESAKLNIEDVVPMPMAREQMATAVKLASLRRTRKACRIDGNMEASSRNFRIAAEMSKSKAAPGLPVSSDDISNSGRQVFIIVFDFGMLRTTTAKRVNVWL